jgi:hypothetical protein
MFAKGENSEEDREKMMDETLEAIENARNN